MKSIKINIKKSIKIIKLYKFKSCVLQNQFNNFKLNNKPEIENKKINLKT